jgi:ribosomal protein S18 acetylase RimI-like enzyme
VTTLFRIRRASIADFEALCVLHEELDEHHRRARPDLFRPPLGDRRERASIAGLIDDASSDILVADIPSRGLVGFVTVIIRHVPASVVRDERQFVEIDGLAVAPAARRLGVGRALVDAARAWSNERGVGALELNVYAFNKDAAAFYEAAGFAPILIRMGREV